MTLTRIRELRLEKGLTIKALATELNIKESTLSKYERAEREPSIEALILLSKFFNVSVDYLVGKDDCKSTENQSISNALGIDEKTINALNSLNKKSNYYTELDYLEAIIQHPNFRDLMSQINSYFVYTVADWSDIYLTSANGDKIREKIPIETIRDSALQLAQTTFKGILESIPSSPHIRNKK